MAGFKPDQVAALDPTAMAGFDATKMAAMDPTAMAGFKSDQVAALQQQWPNSNGWIHANRKWQLWIQRQWTQQPWQDSKSGQIQTMAGFRCHKNGRYGPNRHGRFQTDQMAALDPTAMAGLIHQWLWIQALDGFDQTKVANFDPKCYGWIQTRPTSRHGPNSMAGFNARPSGSTWIQPRWQVLMLPRWQPWIQQPWLDSKRPGGRACSYCNGWFRCHQDGCYGPNSNGRF